MLRSLTPYTTSRQTSGVRIKTIKFLCHYLDESMSAKTAGQGGEEVDDVTEVVGNLLLEMTNSVVCNVEHEAKSETSKRGCQFGIRCNGPLKRIYKIPRKLTNQGNVFYFLIIISFISNPTPVTYNTNNLFTLNFRNKSISADCNQ